MWDEIDNSTLLVLAVAAIVVSVGFAFLKKSRGRTALITTWTSMPFILAIAASAATVFDTRSFDTTAFFGFTAVVSLALLPPWALLTLLPFNLVRRWREIEAGISFRTGS